jgi:hypothetical protein
MKMTIKQEVQVITYSIWVNIRANCYMLGDSIEVEDIEWDDFLYTHLENEAIQELAESVHMVHRFEIEYKALPF